MGIFRIARAEFIKIFKKPSVYLMGVILAAVLVLSLLFFDPIGKQSYVVKLDGTSVDAVYDKFMNNTSTDTNKVSFDNQINESLNKTNFYKILNERNIQLTNIYSEFTTLFNDLDYLNSQTQEDENKINSAFIETKNKLNSLNEEYNNIDVLINNSIFYKHFITLPIYTSLQNDLETLISESDTTPSNFINHYKSNNYNDKFSNLSNYNKNFTKETILYYAREIESQQTEYYNRVINNPDTSQNYFLQLKDNYNSLLTEFLNTLSLLNSDNQTIVFINNTEYNNLKNLVTEAQTIIDSYDNPNNPNKVEYAKHKAIVNDLKNLDLQSSIKDFASKIINFEVNNKLLENIESTIKTQVYTIRENIQTELDEFCQDNTSSSLKDINKVNEIITKYRVLAINTEKYVNDSIDLDSTSGIKLSKINDYLGFKDFNRYKVREELTSSTYYIKNGKFNQNFSDVFAFNKNSGDETSAYDFVYFGMEIATLIIAVFAIFLAASLMASEYDSGTIKLLAMRPFKRWKIITGKLIATMIFVFLFILFSFAICMVAGVCLFPINNTPILMVFNSTNALAISPIVLLIIDLLCIFFEVLFYTVIALSISTIFRSYTSAISISCIMFILATTLNVLLGGYLWYTFIPFINADLFKYLGGNFLTLNSNALTQLFVPTVLANANFYLSLGISVGTIAIFLIITYLSFKLRDF